MATSVRRCIASGLDRRLRDAVHDDSLVVRPAGVELPDVHAAERE